MPSVAVRDFVGRLRVSDRNSDAAIRLVFAGQYSAGKSTLICALTGREDIARGVGIVTDKVTSYEWESLVLVDTPGVHTSLRPDHDELARAEIAASDLLVFVITNELMDSHIAGHFQQLISMEKANVMILVVNKMNRQAGGNTPEARAVMSEDLASRSRPVLTRRAAYHVRRRAGLPRRQTRGRRSTCRAADEGEPHRRVGVSIERVGGSRGLLGG